MQHMAAGMAVTGSGSASPKATLDNHGLSQIVDTSDEWIATRTGIRSRHLAGPQESLASLGAIAARNALSMAQVDATEIDLILLATSTSDDLFGECLSNSG